MKKEFDYVNISVKYFGILWEFWQRSKNEFETSDEFLNRIKTEFRLAFPNKEIQIVCIYKPYTITLIS